jgi:general stress protein 26
MTIVTVPPPASAEQREHLIKLLRQFSTAMLVTHAGDNRLRARPMAIGGVGDDAVVWFITGLDTAKAHEIENDTRVHLVCQNEDSAYLSLCGSATLLQERTRIDQLWQEPFKVWFPQGREDPNIVVIRVRIEEAEYWDNEGWNKVKYLVQSAKAYVKGTTPEPEDDDQHAFVRLV